MSTSDLRKRAHAALVADEADLLRQIIAGQESRASLCDRLTSVYYGMREIDARIERPQDDAYVI